MKIEMIAEKMGLGKLELINEQTSRLGGKVLELKDHNGRMTFLKIGRGIEAEALKREKIALDWLDNKSITVPTVIGYLEEGVCTYLMQSALKGTPAHKAPLQKNEVLRIAANTLKRLHSVKIDGAQTLRTLEDDLSQINHCLKHDLIDIDKFTTANDDRTPEDVYFYLLTNQDRFSKATLTHGDYCLPNIIISGDDAGMIDIGDCGIGDPYKDFSAMEVSIRRNFGQEWIDEFYRYYGIQKRDDFKVRYYQLIDQFSYHLDIEKYKSQK